MASRILCGIVTFLRVLYGRADRGYNVDKREGLFHGFQREKL